MGSRRKFSQEFKLEAVRLACQEGVSVAQVARDLGIRPESLYKWKQVFADEGEKAFPGKGKARDEELASLRRELGRVKRERNFLREAAAYFAKESK